MSKTLPQGKVVRAVGVVVDAYFPDHMPEKYSALHVPDMTPPLTLEVQAHVGDGVVRCVSMSWTDGLAAGQVVVDTLAPISVPVGEAALGRVFNVTGDPIDGGKKIEKAE